MPDAAETKRSVGQMARRTTPAEVVGGEPVVGGIDARKLQVGLFRHLKLADADVGGEPKVTMTVNLDGLDVDVGQSETVVNARQAASLLVEEQQPDIIGTGPEPVLMVHDGRTYVDDVESVAV